MGLSKAVLQRLVLVVLLFSTMVCVAAADVTIKQTATTSGLGGFLNVEIKTETMIQGDKQCTETETRMKGTLLSLFGGGKPTKETAITRLDEGVIWNIDHKKKRYTETSLERMKEMMESLGSGSMMSNGQGDDGEPDFDTSQFTMAPPKFSVEKTGKTGTYAGYDCEESRLIMEMEGQNKETGETINFKIVMDMMLSEDVPGQEESQAFAKSYLEATGMGNMAEDISGASMLQAMSQYGIDTEGFRNEAEKLKGYPLRTVMKMYADGLGGMGAMGGMSVEDQKNMDEAQAEMKKAMSKLGGMFGRKKKDKDKEEEPEEDAAPSDGSMMTMTMEVTEISTRSISADRFEVPKKYKRKKSPYDSE